MSTGSVGATRLTTKGQVVIPKAVRDRMGWKPGAALEVAVSPDGERVVFRRARRGTASAWVEGVAGIVTRGDPVGDLEREHRREIERDARHRT